MRRAWVYAAIAASALVIGGAATYATVLLHSWQQVLNSSGLPAEIDTYSGYPLPVWKVVHEVSFIGEFGQEFFPINALLDLSAYALASAVAMAAVFGAHVAMRRRSRPSP